MLNVDNVQKIMIDSLYNKDEKVNYFVAATGVVSNYGFHPGRLSNNRRKIRELLSQLPDSFSTEIGDSFLNACQDKEGNLWGQHINVEALMVLGLAAGYIESAPRETWFLLPGGMPVFRVLSSEEIDKPLPLSYVCENCKKIYLTDSSEWSEKDAIDEASENFREVSEEDLARVCDDCYKSIMAGVSN